MTLVPWKKSYDQPRQHIKSGDITLPTKVRLVKAMVFLVVTYGCESWTIKKAERQRIDAFELCCWRRLLRVFSRVQLFATPRTAAHQASLSLTTSQSLLKFMSIELVILSNHLILCCPLLLLPSIFPSIRVFPNELAGSSHQAAKVLEHQLQHRSFQ